MAQSRYHRLLADRTRLAAERDALDAELAAQTDETAEEQTASTARVEELVGRIRANARAIEAEEAARTELRNAPAVESPRVEVGADRALSEPWGGERYARIADEKTRTTAQLGAFLQAVAAAGTPGGHIDPRLYQAAPSGINTGTPSDGGFLVRTDFTTMLLESGFAEAVLAPRCTPIPIGADADSVEAPVIDQTSRANGSRWGGVRVYRRAEADTVTATKPRWGEWELRLEDLMAICYATDRSIKDALSLGAMMQKAFAEEFAFKVDDEIVRGTGVGECEGLLNAAATVSVSKEIGQAATSIVKANIEKMYARMHARSLARAVWYINQDVWPALFNLTADVGTGGVPVFLPPGGLSAAPYGMLMGRPIEPIEQAESLGTVGDLILADLSQYVLATKGGIEQAESIHVRFLYGERTFRWMTRVNGRPKWKSALTPFKGSNTQSPFITLATRA